MFLKHRMRAFQRTFQANPDYAPWYGRSERQRDLAEIKEAAAQLRKGRGPKKVVAASPVRKPATPKP